MASPSSINYMQIIEPMKICPYDLERIADLLSTIFYPKNSIDAALMQGIIDWIRNEIKKHNDELQKNLLNSITFASNQDSNIGTVYRADWVDDNEKPKQAKKKRGIRKK